MGRWRHDRARPPFPPARRPGAGATFRRCRRWPRRAPTGRGAGRHCRGSTAARAAAAVRRRPASTSGDSRDRPARRSRPSHPLGRLAGKTGLVAAGSAATMRRPGSSRSSTSRPAPPTISPPRSSSTTTRRPRSSRPSSATGWANRLTAHRARQGRAADAAPAADGERRLRQPDRPGRGRRGREPGRGDARRRRPRHAGSTARSTSSAKAPMPRSPARCSRAAASGMTPISSSATRVPDGTSRQIWRSVADDARPARSPPGSRSRATRRRPTASRS